MSPRAYRLSRSQLDLSLECARCYWRQAHGVKRPPGLPFTINSAIDKRLKEEFDTFRQQRRPHPAVPTHLVPATHPQLDAWRNNFKGVEARHPSGVVVCGAIDDLWADGKNYYVADYKATGSQSVTCWPRDKRQLEIYRWLLVKNGLNMAPIGYRVAVQVDHGVMKFTLFDLIDGKSPAPARLIFRFFTEAVALDDSWVAEAIDRALAIRSQREMPPPGGVDGACKYCAYFSEVANQDFGRGQKAQEEKENESKAKEEKGQANEDQAPGHEVDSGDDDSSL